MKFKTFQIIYNFIILVFIVNLGIIVFPDYYNNNNINEQEEVSSIVKLEEPDFFFKSPQEGILEALKYYRVKYPDIVYAQAILETGNFRSKVCKDYNNLFGLYNSSKKDYYRFNHWTESIEGYIKYIQERYKPPNEESDNELNYYKFLEKIGYAENSILYTSKIKEIVNRNRR